MSRFCTECGAKLEPDSKFCPECGKPVEMETVQEQTPIANGTQAETNKVVPTIKQEIQTTASEYRVSDKGLIFKSTAPIPAKARWARWGYIISLLLCFAGGVGILGLILVFIAQDMAIKRHRGILRRTPYRFVEGNITSDEIYEKIQPELSHRYGNRIEFEREGDTLSVMYDSVIYDINVNGDGTFRIWWRKSLTGAFFMFNEFKLYKKIRTAMPIIGYTMQKQFGVI